MLRAEARDHLRQRNQPRFGRGIMGRARAAILAADRADMDDAAAARLLQQRQENLRADERALEIGRRGSCPSRHR